MKKLYCLLAGITLVLVGIVPTYAQLKPVSQLMLTRMLTDTKYYMFDRVKTMCSEWPGCEAWALARHANNPSFTIIDAEVEYYVPKEGSSNWHYTMYVETMENLQTQTYVFAATENNFPGTAPSKFKKFPGHPFTDMPSEHAKYEREVWDPYGKLPPRSKLRKRWPKALDAVWEVAAHAREQQRVIWDKNGNPRWERRVDITPNGEYVRDIAIIARQQKLGAPFEYLSARETNSILKAAPYRAEFSFAKKY